MRVASLTAGPDRSLPATYHACKRYQPRSPVRVTMRAFAQVSPEQD